MPATPQPIRMWVALMRWWSAESRVVTEPISTSPPPEGYLVNACTDTSTPSRNGSNARPAPQVLSSATTASGADRRTVSTSAATSGNSIVIEPGASIHTSFVAGPMAAASDAGSIGSYRSCETPQRTSSSRAKARLGP